MLAQASSTDVVVGITLVTLVGACLPELLLTTSHLAHPKRPTPNTVLFSLMLALSVYLVYRYWLVPFWRTQQSQDMRRAEQTILRLQEQIRDNQLRKRDRIPRRAPDGSIELLDIN
eukprot:c40128_g1_i1.p1 GENE.c40128_g1_i1~~c40128_g1_i1.p1  ORF type:complete len:116 (-),score=9.04 c40128_g1_i1:64-411(-)